MRDNLEDQDWEKVLAEVDDNFYIEEHEIIDVGESLAASWLGAPAAWAADPAEISSEEEAKDAFEDLIGVLSERNQDVLRRRLGFECEVETLEEIGKSWDVTRECIRQIEASSYRTLKQPEFSHLREKFMSTCPEKMVSKFVNSQDKYSKPIK